METEGGKQSELLGPLGPRSGSLSGPIVSRMSTRINTLDIEVECYASSIPLWYI